MFERIEWGDVFGFRALLFPAVFFLVAVWEAVAPARTPNSPVSPRWVGNLSMIALTSAILAFMPIATSLSAALTAQHNGWGVLNVWRAPLALSLVLSLIVLDFGAYWAHRLFHALPSLWRLHALHHADTDLDVASSVRHHPFEALLMAALDALVVLAIGIPPAGALVYASLLGVVQSFNHGNVALPRRLHWLDRYIVTPELHRLHHSMEYDENNSNFANLFPIWDRMFGTLKEEPRGVLRIGLPEFADAKFQRLDKMLLLPLFVRPANSSIPQRTG